MPPAGEALTAEEVGLLRGVDRSRIGLARTARTWPIHGLKMHAVTGPFSRCAPSIPPQ